MLKGKKTIIGSILLGLLAAIYGIDQWVEPDKWWLPYETMIGIIGAWTGVSLRLAIAKGK